MAPETLLEFPTAFPIKAVGRDEQEFRQLVEEIVAAHAEFDPQQDVKVQVSGNGNFVSVTVTVNAESQQQLDTIYQLLHDNDRVLMAL